jgi:uncharacterized protein
MKRIISIAFLLAACSIALLGAQASFFEACKKGTAADILLALGAGASVAARDEVGNTPLMAAAQFNPSPDAIQALLKAGSALTERNERGSTPLMFAVRNSNSAVALALLKAGASARDRNQDGSSALMYAAKFAVDVDLVSALLKAGASVREQDSDGCTPLI